MRKRLLIGAIVAVVIGVAAYFLSQPRRGTVDYHKRKLAEAGVPVWVLKKGVPGIVRKFYERRFMHQSDFHRTALIDSGYLKESIVVVTNSAPPLLVWKAAALDLLGAVPKDIWNFTMIEQTETNVLRIIAPGEWIEKFGEAVREVDAPDAKWRDIAFPKADVPQTK